ncbi:MAG: tRNA (adenosine(37)-N6)-dimethylallyltransferase MiaA [Aliishimia sp.]
MFDRYIDELDPDRPVLIAGPTASGKSGLALAIAERQGGTIVNADASQVYACWRVVTARPSIEDEARATHALYGHLPHDAVYSAGHWLRDVTPLLKAGQRPIIVGGTGLNFTALTEGLTEIPATPPELRASADKKTLPELIAEIDALSASRIDLANRARVQRAWEVLRATGQGIAQWQDQTPPPVLRIKDAHTFVMDAPKDWLTPRINARFDQMLEQGALTEVSAMASQYDQSLPAFRAIGVPELMAYHSGDMTLAAARESATIATRQYAKRQRTWLRARCKTWTWVECPIK